jgi:hypothetical protein
MHKKLLIFLRSDIKIFVVNDLIFCCKAILFVLQITITTDIGGIDGNIFKLINQP